MRGRCIVLVGLCAVLVVVGCVRASPCTVLYYFCEVSSARTSGCVGLESACLVWYWTLRW
jgi:hypothetical protein